MGLIEQQPKPRAPKRAEWRCPTCGAHRRELRAQINVELWPVQCEAEYCRTCGCLVSFLAPLTREREFWELGAAGGALVMRFFVERDAPIAAVAPPVVEQEVDAA